MSHNEPQPERLRLLLADESDKRLRSLAGIVEELGHEVVAQAVTVREAAELVASLDPDAALVAVHEDDEHALGLIAETSSYASGPVIAVLQEESPEFVRRAADLGIHAYAHTPSASALQGAIDLAVKRHAELQALDDRVEQLETALERRATIERAKGILMERHSVDDAEAFELLRAQARRMQRSVADLARAVNEGHALLPK